MYYNGIGDIIQNGQNLFQLDFTENSSYPKKCRNKAFFIIKVARQKTDQNTLESLYNQ